LAPGFPIAPSTFAVPGACEAMAQAGGMVRCCDCNGGGQCIQVVRMGPMIQQMMAQCGRCSGTGHAAVCVACRGCGQVRYNNLMDHLFDQFFPGIGGFRQCAECDGKGQLASKPAAVPSRAPSFSWPSLEGAPSTAQSRKRKRVSEMTKVEMQTELHKMRRKTSGNKAELKERLDEVFETNSRGWKRTSAQMEAGRFLDAGSFRNVYLTTYTKGPRKGQQGVYKIFKDKGGDDSTADDLRAVAEAGRIIEAFNMHNDAISAVQGAEARRRVYLNQPEVWSMDSRPILVEPFIEGNYAKFNSNSGWVSEDNEYRLMQALSHFSFHFTKGTRLLCDLQGGGYATRFVLTDPAMLSVSKEYEQTDGGPKFMRNFFAHHRCNKYCDKGWQCLVGARPEFQPRMGTSFLRPKATGRSTAFDAIRNKHFHR